MTLNNVSAYFWGTTCGILLMLSNASAQVPVPLGTASTYGVLAGDSIVNTGATTITGDLGLSPGSAVTGGAVVVGASDVDNPAAVLAKNNLRAAFLNAQGRVGAATVTAGALGGLVLTPGLYKDDGAPASLGLTGTLTLDFQGDPNAVFIFQSASTLTTAVGSSVALTNNAGGQGCNVYWQLGSAATLKTNTTFVGTILANDDITLQAGATVTGRLLAGAQANGAGALVLNNNTIAVAVCSVATPPPPATGSITVVKNSVGGNGAFAFTSNFGLTSPLTTVGGTISQTVGGLTPGGGYTLSESIPAGWTQTNASCTNGTPAAITVVAGTTTTCTITNTVVILPPTGSITVVKNAVGGNGAFAFTSNFGLISLTTSGGAASQTFWDLTPGSGYSLSEIVPSGWTQTSATCTNGTPAAITVLDGMTTTCIITNAVVTLPDLVIAKSHAGDFRQGDTGDTYSLTVSNVGQTATTGAVAVSDALPVGLTATAVGGTGWSCALTSLTCTRSDALAAGNSYPVITVTVSVANNGLAFGPAAGNTGFQTGDILLSMADGSVQWRHRDWTSLKLVTGPIFFAYSTDAGQAKGMAFDRSGSLYVTHWYSAGLTGNDVVKFDRNGSLLGFFGGGYDCNPSSMVFDNSGNAYVGQADCSTQILKVDPSGNLVSRYSVAVENRGSGHIALDPNQCTMYYTSEGPDVKRFDVCSNTQMPNFNTAPLPDAVSGAQQFSPLPGGGMLVADFSVIASLDASGNLARTYGASGGHCWLGMALDADGVSFWASDWCSSVVTRFDIATGNVIESHVASGSGFMVKQIITVPNVFSIAVTNAATVAGGGESNASNDSASDVTTVDPPGPPTLAAGIVNAASYAPTVAAGGIASIFGSDLSSGQAIAGAIPLPTTLAASSFQIGGRVAPLLSASPGRVNLQVPWELAGQPQATVIGTVAGVIPTEQTMSLAPFAPGIFALNGAGSSIAPFAPAIFALNEADPSQGLVVIADSQVLAPPVGGSAKPVSPGASISIYCTGLGAVSNQPATGFAAQANPLSVTTTTPTVTIGGVVAPVSFSGLAPGAVGLYLVTVQVPAGTPSGDAVPILLSIGGFTSNTVTIAVQ